MEIYIYVPEYELNLIRADILTDDELHRLKLFASRITKKVGPGHFGFLKYNGNDVGVFDEVGLYDLDDKLEFLRFVKEVEERMSKPKKKKYKDGSEVRELEHRHYDEEER